MTPSNKKKRISNCDDCMHFIYDEVMDCDVCNVNLDEDEYAKYMASSYRDCPYYHPYDEYKSVQKQN